jgi:hypothetical protein
MKEMLRSNVLRSRPVPQGEDSSWMRMKNVSVLQDMLLMKMAIVFLVHLNLDLSSMPMEDVSVIVPEDSF